MITSMDWLSRYVDIPWDAEELAERLTVAGLEAESVSRTHSIPDGVVIGEILSREPHPDADKLSLCEVSVGGDTPLSVVCGAPNCDVGLRVPLATVGTVFSDGTKIRKAKIRGATSFGMLCSERELGLGEDHSGLLVLPGDAPVGTPLATHLSADTVIEWEVTPNRPDWLSHIGIAREIAAVADRPDSMRLPAFELVATDREQAGNVTSVDVQAPDLCPRYIARVIRNVTVAPSPDWLQQALRAVGVRPINNVVDVTNYVLMECGQPLHAFDYDLLAEHRIVVRRARDGEHLVTLDGEEHTLTTENLLIADADRGVALAGIMGGGNSEIGDGTTTVLLESAAFSPANIRATAKGLGVSTEASYRFERGIDFEGVEFASARATVMIAELAGGDVLTGKVDAMVAPAERPLVECRVSRTRDLLGVDVGVDEISRFLTRLQLDVVRADSARVTVRVPSFRLDLEREVDLIEEVARLYGLVNVPAQPEAARVGGTMADDAYYPIEYARADLLALGLDEIMNPSLLSQEAATTRTNVAPESIVTLSNPLSVDYACMRPSLLPGLLQTVRHNVSRHNMDLALFEIGRVIEAAPSTSEERCQAGIVLTGRRHPERYGEEGGTPVDFFDLKGLLEGWFEGRRLDDVRFVPAPFPAFAAGTSAEILAGGRSVGFCGEIAEELAADMRLTQALFVALVELDTLVGLTPPPPVYAPLPQFPATCRDISMEVASGISNQEILDAIRGQDCAWLVSVDLFDVFEDEGALGKDVRSLAYSLTYLDRSRTLTDEEVNAAHGKLKDGLAKQLPIKFR